MVFVLLAEPLVELLLRCAALSCLTQHIRAIWIVHLPAYPWNSADSGALCQCQWPSVRAGAVLDELGEAGDVFPRQLFVPGGLELHLQLSGSSQGAPSLSSGAEIQIFHVWCGSQQRI